MEFSIQLFKDLTKNGQSLDLDSFEYSSGIKYDTQEKDIFKFIDEFIDNNKKSIINSDG